MKYLASGVVASLPSSKRIPVCIMGLLAGCAIALAQPGTINTYAGAYPTGWGGPPLRAVLSNGPGHMAQDANGNIYIAALARIFKLSPDGILTLFAGTGVRASTGDGAPALQARVNCGFFSGIAVDPQGNVVFAETAGHKIRLISPDGVIRTLAGTGVAGYAGDSGPANVALLRQPQGMVFDSAGNLYFADAGNFRIRRITPGGTISTIAGNGTSAFGGDGGPATQASLSGISDVALDSAGNLYISDSFNLRVRRVAPDGTINTVAGAGQPGSDVTDSHGNHIDWTNMCALAIDRSDNLYIALEDHVLRRDAAGKVTVVAGTGGFSIDDYLGPAIEAPLFVPLGLLVDRNGNLLLGLSREQRVAKIDPAGILSTLVGEKFDAGSTGPLAYARLVHPRDAVFDRSGTLYILENAVPTLRRVTPSGLVTVIDDLYDAQNITADSQGNVYVSDQGTDAIWKLDTEGKIRRYAGRGVATFDGDNGPAVEAGLNNPNNLAFDTDGSLYFADSGNNRVRRVMPDGTIRTVAGAGTAGFGGDNGPALSALLNFPRGIAIDKAHNLYVADSNNNRIRRITPQGVVTTYAGTGQSGSTGDGGPAAQALIQNPRGLVLDSEDNLYFVEVGAKVRKITFNAIISTVAGNGNLGLSGDGGPALSASFNNVQNVTLDNNGNIFIIDQDNDRIRRVQGTAPFNATPASLVFAYGLGSPAADQTIRLSSSDGETRTFQVTSSARWLTVSPSVGQVTTPVTLTVTANPAGLGKGTYSGQLKIESGSGSSTVVLVTMTISGTAAQMRLSKVGLTLTAVQGGSAPPPQTLQVLNTGTGSMSWSASATTVAGNATWLTVAPPSGTTTAGAAAPSLTIGVNPAGLAAGSYYGQVNVTSSSADNTPQSAIVLLNVLPADGTPGPQVDPSGLLFTAAPAANPATQSIEIANVSTRTSNYTAAVRFTSGSGWLTAPPAGTLTAGQRRAIDIQPRATSLAAGVYRATITFTFTPDNVSRTVDVALVVNAAVGAANAAKTNAAGVSCAAKQLVTVLRRPGASYQTAAGWPVSVEAAVVDDCGTALTEGKVITSFSTNDPLLPLLHTGNGIWQGTWASRSANAALTVTVKAQSSDQNLTGQAQVAIRSDLNPNQPSIASGGILNGASFRNDTPVSPGEYVSVFGARLAGQFQQATTLPLPTTLGDTLVAIGGMVAPLHFASDGQVNAILPYGIPDSTRLQMIVQRGNLLSIPEDVLIGTTQPAVFTIDGTGTGQGHIYGATAEGTLLADNAHPVKAGDTIVLLATGLGPVNPPVAAANPAPSDPLSLAVNPIEVTIQGKKARVLFAGLAPGFVGVFQVNAIVPDDVAVETAAQLIVIAGGQPSPPVTMAITRNPI